MTTSTESSALSPSANTGITATFSWQQSLSDDCDDADYNDDGGGILSAALQRTQSTDTLDGSRMGFNLSASRFYLVGPILLWSMGPIQGLIIFSGVCCMEYGTKPVWTSYKQQQQHQKNPRLSIPMSQHAMLKSTLGSIAGILFLTSGMLLWKRQQQMSSGYGNDLVGMSGGIPRTEDQKGGWQLLPLFTMLSSSSLSSSSSSTTTSPSIVTSSVIGIVIIALMAVSTLTPAISSLKYKNRVSTYLSPPGSYILLFTFVYLTIIGTLLWTCLKHSSSSDDGGDDQLSNKATLHQSSTAATTTTSPTISIIPIVIMTVIAILLQSLAMSSLRLRHKNRILMYLAPPGSVIILLSMYAYSSLTLD